MHIKVSKLLPILEDYGTEVVLGRECGSDYMLTKMLKEDANAGYYAQNTGITDPVYTLASYAYQLSATKRSKADTERSKETNATHDKANVVVQEKASAASDSYINSAIPPVKDK